MASEDAIQVSRCSETQSQEDPIGSYNASSRDGLKISLWLDEVTNGTFTKVKDYFPESPGVWAVGGAVRDYFLGRRPSDLDVAVCGITTPDLSRIPGLGYNHFGGGQATINGVGIDVWPLELSAVLQGTNLPRTIEGLLRAFDFNLERIAVEANTSALVDGGCLDGIRDRVIDYDPVNPSGSMIQAARLVMLHRKTGFDYSPRALRLLRYGSQAAKDPERWGEAVAFFNKGGKYVAQIESLRQELIGSEG